MLKHALDHEVDHDCHLARTATKFGERTNEITYANNGTPNTKLMAHLLRNLLALYRTLHQHHESRRIILVLDLFPTLQHTQRPLKLQARTSPLAKTAQIGIYPPIPPLKKPNPKPRTPTKSAVSIAQPNETPKIDVAYSHSRRLRQGGGHPNRCLSERWRWSAKDSKNGKRVRRKSRVRSLRVMVWMVLVVELVGSGM
jgi:hypothetical protein